MATLYEVTYLDMDRPGSSCRLQPLSGRWLAEQLGDVASGWNGGVVLELRTTCNDGSERASSNLF